MASDSVLCASGQQAVAGSSSFSVAFSSVPPDNAVVTIEFRCGDSPITGDPTATVNGQAATFLKRDNRAGDSESMSTLAIKLSSYSAGNVVVTAPGGQTWGNCSIKARYFTGTFGALTVSEIMGTVVAAQGSGNTPTVNISPPGNTLLMAHYVNKAGAVSHTPRTNWTEQFDATQSGVWGHSGAFRNGATDTAASATAGGSGGWIIHAWFITEAAAGNELTGAITAPMATADGDVAVAVTLSGVVTAPMATAAGSATVDVSLTGAVTAPMATATGAAQVAVTLSGAVDAPMATAAGDAAVAVTLNGAVNAPMAVAAGTAEVATVDRQLSGDVTAPMATATGSAVVAVTLQGSVTAPMAVAAGTVVLDQTAVTLTGAVTAPMATASGSVSVQVGLSGSITAPMATAAGSASVAVSLSGAITAPQATASGTAVVGSLGAVTLTGAVVAPMAVAAGIIRHTLKPPTTANVRSSLNSVTIRPSLTTIRTPNT